MNDIVTWTALGLGALLILTHLIIAIVAAAKGPAGGTGTLSEAANRAADLLDKLVDKVPLVAAGILLILIAAVTSGALTASVVFGG